MSEPSGSPSLFPQPTTNSASAIVARDRRMAGAYVQPPVARSQHHIAATADKSARALSADERTVSSVSVLGVTTSNGRVSVVIRLRVADANEHWRTEPWVYAKAVKWFEDAEHAIAEAERLNSLEDNPLYVYFVSHPKPGRP